jgi:hypothetical protein
MNYGKVIGPEKGSFSLSIDLTFVPFRPHSKLIGMSFAHPFIEYSSHKRKGMHTTMKKMQIAIVVFGLVLGLFVSSAPCTASLENLDEMANRVARMNAGANTFSYLYMESGSYYLWQPETLRYTDTTYGTEVWKIAGSGMEVNQFQDISFPQFSADGKYIVFRTDRSTASLSTPSWGSDYAPDGGLNMLLKMDGTVLRPMPGSSNLCNPNWFYHWSPVELNTAYNFSRCLCGFSGNAYTLYQDTVSDTSESTSGYLTFPQNYPYSPTTYELVKGFSADGTVVMANIVYGAAGWLQPAQVYPTASKALLVADAYPNHRPSYDSYWGDNSSVTWGGFHDQYMSGALSTTIWLHWMPEQNGIGIWWRSTPTGTETDGGPKYTLNHSGTYNPHPWGGQMEPTNTITSSYNQLDPWQNPTGTPVANAAYFGHYTPDRWGHYIIFSNGNTSPYGSTIWDSTNDVITATGFGTFAAHNDWHAWSDWSAHDYLTNSSDATTLIVGTQNYVSSTHVPLCMENGTNAASGSGDLGPTQSPDGTKITFVSTFISSSASAWNLFYVVAYYPHPPEIYSASASGGNVTLTFDYGNNSGTPRGYTTRKWPNESTGTYPPPRELKQFRLWSSANGTSGWTPVTETAYTGWSRYNFSTGVWSGDTYEQITTTQAAGTTMYYALTAQENSGLEGTIGNVWQVTLTSGGAISSSVQQTTYPSTPGAKPTHYTTAPGAPAGLTVAYEQSPATAPGQYTISWTAPSDPSGLIRHYNLYALDGSTPTAIQNRRVASIPVGATSFIDWLGNTSGSTEYALTSVDYFGNESQAATVGKTDPPPPAPTGVHLVE